MLIQAYSPFNGLVRNKKDYLAAIMAPGSPFLVVENYFSKNIFHMRMIIVIIKKIRQKDGPYD
ncbi:hypothetical protein BK141_27040 [Paenibacillus sp. FSL R5-0765]|nr:hypothetical protein BK141_27040 [Paenibacillus sp. FSL R5-0765]